MVAAAPAPPPAESRWRKVALVVFLLGLVAAGAWMIYGHLRAWQAQSAGKAALARGDLSAAVERLEAAQKAYPDSAEICFLLGQALRRHGDLARAARMFDEAERIGWVEPAIALERILLAAQRGRFTSVEKTLKEALASDHPDAALICEVMVPLVLERREIDRASALLQKWETLAPGNGLVAYWRGRLDEVRLDPGLAQEDYEKAVEALPDLFAARFALARVLLDRDLHQVARPHLERLLKDRPRDAGLQLLRARYLVLAGEADQARTILERLLADRPDDPDLLRLRGTLELDDGNPLKAVSYLSRAASLKKDDPDILAARLRCLEATGPRTQADDVRAHLKRVKEELAAVPGLIQKSVETPTDPQPRRQIGEAYLRIGQERNGLLWLQSAYLAAPKDASTNRALAAFFARKGDQQSAARFSKAAAGKP